MNKKSYWRFYVLSLAVLLLLSAYPLVNGARMAVLCLQNGVLEPGQYVKYVVPYAAICVALVLFAAFQPLLDRLKRLAFPVGTAAAFGVFFAVERFFETMQIRTTGLTLIDAATMTTDTAIDTTADVWQAALCIASPATRAQSATYAATDSFYYVIGNSTYKIHYYMVSLILITMVCGLIAGIGKALRVGGDSRPLILRGISSAALIALCVFANTTAFFRQAAPIQTPIASVLTCLFFVVLGASAGVYTGSYLTRRGIRLGVALPVVASIAVTVLMYIGEAAMMRGGLYRFGTGWFFSGLPGIVLAPVDALVVLLSGALTWLTLGMARRHERWPGKRTAIVAAVLCAGIAVSGVVLSAPAGEDDDALGCYEYAECIYMNPLSSFAAFGKLPYTYWLTESELVIQHNDSGAVERYAARYEKTPVAEDEFLSQSEMSMWLPDLSVYKSRYRLGTMAGDMTYALYLLDGETWLVNIRGVGVWSIYRIEKLGDRPAP